MKARLALLVASLIAADGALYLLVRALDAWRLFYDRSAVSAERIDYWLAASYDAELGWDVPAASKNNLGAARRGDYPVERAYKLKAFGDSFVFGSDVADTQSWLRVIESQAGWSALNYGVPGYGPDQALLKYRRTNVRTEFSVLGIQQENIGRVVNIYRAFYMDDWGPTKPRFFLDGAGLRIEPNPIGRREDARRLLDPSFVDGLRRRDYWPGYNEDVLGAPRRLGWPVSWVLLRHAPFFLDRAWLELELRRHPTYELEIRRFRPYHLYQESSEAFQILSRLIDEFVKVCGERGEKPLVVVFPLEHTVKLMRTYGRCVYEPLARRLRERGIPHIDLGPVFARENYAGYYLAESGHFSAAGNERLAREAIHHLQR